jgi:DTW domain-containing protein YfiP
MAPGFDAEKKEQAKQAQREIRDARRIQRALDCTWTEALRIARTSPTRH